jgi:hypothetical protein
MKVCAAILACAAVLIAVQKRGLLDLGHVGSEALAWSSHALALAGGVYLIHIWWAHRFRVSIGRLMLVVALVAVLIQSVSAYTRWMKGGLPKPSGTPSAPPK